jgi:hypothetical protein
MTSDYRPVEVDEDAQESHEPLLVSAAHSLNQLVHEQSPQVGTASSFSCIINLANTILGTGMLAMVR